MRPVIGIVGTTGIEKERMINIRERQIICTRYGEVPVFIGVIEDIPVAFISRSGYRHPLEPGRVNYRANVLAFQELQIQRVIGSVVAGSLTPQLVPGSLVTVHQFLDFTKHRPPTLFDDYGFRFTDMTDPYCQHIREGIQQAAEGYSLPLVVEGCYVGVDGPRYETAAEVTMYARLGGHLIGHTGVTEVIMAREAGLCYACVAIVANLAAGISTTPISNQDVTTIRLENAIKVERLLAATVQWLARQSDWSCTCPRAQADPQIPPWHYRVGHASREEDSSCLV